MDISSNSVPPFSSRFQKNYIFFSNARAYRAYRLIFPTVANAAAANSMQIAEVEFLGVLATPAPTPVPRLTFQGAGDQLTLSWPLTFLGFNLQSGSAVNGPWTDLSGVINHLKPVASGSGASFFRLVQP